MLNYHGSCCAHNRIPDDAKPGDAHQDTGIRVPSVLASGKAKESLVGGQLSAQLGS